MEIGTAEITELPGEDKKKPKSRTRLTSGGKPGKGGGGNGGGGGGGDNKNPENDQSEEAREFIPNKSKFITGFLIVIVFMTFAGVLGAYIVIATNGAGQWIPFSLPVPVWISTFLLLASSVTYHIAKRAFDRGLQLSAKKWLVITTVLGGMFIASQLVAWLELVKRGMYVYSNPYAGFFYILTGLHAIHVIGGIIALGWIILRSWIPTVDETEMLRRRTMAGVVGWYWHFLDGLWLLLFFMLGFWT
jgi:cytochrome c oxidase subunit 3